MRRLVGALGVLLILCTAGPAAAASTNDSVLDIVSTSVDDHPSVGVTVSAPPQLVGQEIPGSAFAITENGVERPVDATPLPSDDLSIVLLIDTSGSMRGAAMEAAKTAAAEFVGAMPTGAKVAVMGFGDTPALAHPFSEDADGLGSAIRGLEPGGETALYDAVAAAAAQFENINEGRHTIVLLSDGGDTASDLSIGEAVEGLSQSGAALTAVQLETSETDGAALADLAAAGGGEVVPADDPDALTGVYEAIAAELTNQYELTFTSEAHDSAKVRISVQHNGVEAQAATTLSLPAEPAAVVSATSQNEEPVELRIVSVDAREHPEMAVRVVAPRQLRHTDLAAGAFTILENGAAREVAVTGIDGVALEVVLVIDTSGSMQGAAIEAAKGAALDFLEGIPTGTRAAIVAVSTEPKLVSDFTTDVTALRAAIASLVADGDTALYDAAATAAGLFSDDRPSLRSAVLLSDGGDTHSSATLESVSERLAEMDVASHAVHIATGETDVTALSRLVGPSGGRVVPVEDEARLAGIFAELAEDVGNQYVLRYRSEAYAATDIGVRVDADGVSGEATRTAVLPRASRWEELTASRLGLIVGAAACYVAMALLILVLVMPRVRRGQLAGHHSQKRVGSTSSLGEIAGRASDYAERSLYRHGRRNSLNDALERAGINLRPGEYLVFCASAALAAAVVGLLVGGFALALLLAVASLLVCRSVPSILARRRQEKFGSQLTDTLQLLAGALRAGYGLLQAVDAVAGEAESPTSDEFRRLVVETRLGRDLDSSLRSLAKRTGSKDFEWVVQAIDIHREVGGDLADVLDTVAGTIREREQIRRHIAALSAEGKLSAIVLAALPFAVAGAMSVINPGYMGVLFNTKPGLTALITGLVLMAFGCLWMRKLVQLKF